MKSRMGTCLIKRAGADLPRTAWPWEQGRLAFGSLGPSGSQGGEALARGICMTDLIDRGSRLGESSLYKDRMLSVVQSGASWPQVERRRGPRRHAEVDATVDRRSPIEPVLQLAVLPE